MRDPFSRIEVPTIAEIMKSYGYLTAGFVGSGMLGEKCGFARGFDYWNEPDARTAFAEVRYETHGQIARAYEGNYWLRKFFQWVTKPHDRPFFVWGHFYETHEGSEKILLRKGLISSRLHGTYGYYDAKILLADNRLIRRLLRFLRTSKLMEQTLLVIMSDHGTNTGEHPARSIPWREYSVVYPQHMSMYDHDLKVALLLMGPGLPMMKRIDSMVRSIDLFPTILDLSGISVGLMDLDGQSLAPLLKNDPARSEPAYAEDICELRGTGFLQAVRTEEVKLIRNLTLGWEEYYDLVHDPLETTNIIDRAPRGNLVYLRQILNDHLLFRIPPVNPSSAGEAHE